MKKLFILLIIPFLSFGQEGCMDEAACNYDSNATVNLNCLYPGDSCNIPCQFIPFYTEDGTNCGTPAFTIDICEEYNENCDCVCIDDVNENGICDHEECLQDFNGNGICDYEECGCLDDGQQSWSLFPGNPACNYDAEAPVGCSFYVPDGLGGANIETCCVYDEGCVNISELKKIDKILKKIDILGRETNTNKGFQLHIYDDGSVEKKYLIK